MTTFKEGKTIKMKEDCGDVNEGEICELHWGIRNEEYKGILYAWGREGYCYHQDKWELHPRTIEDVKPGDLISDGEWFMRVLDVGIKRGFVITTYFWEEGEKEMTEYGYTYTIKELKEKGYEIIEELEEDIVNIIVNKFLRWKLPEDFSPDAGISFKKEFNEGTKYTMKHEPIGTNLLNFDQAKEMIEYILKDIDIKSIKTYNKKEVKERLSALREIK